MLFQLKEIDRALEWAVRDMAVELGYWPNVRAMQAAGTLTDQSLNAAVVALVAAGGPVVEVFGPGGYKERGEMVADSIVITRLTNSPGSYATGDPIDDEPDPAVPGTFRRVRRPDGPEHIQYDVRFLSDNTAHDRLLTQLVLAAFPWRLYLSGMNDDLSPKPEAFWVMRGTAVDLSTADFLERLWRVEVRDVQLVPDRIVQTGIPAATVLGLEVQATRTPEEPGEEAGLLARQVAPG